MRIFKISILTLVFLGLCIYRSNAIAAVSMTASYSDTANILQIFDCVSDRNQPDTEEDCQDDGGYRKDWIKRFGDFSAQDQELLAKYSAVRKRHYSDDPDQKIDDPLKKQNGFFAPAGIERFDPIAKAFYSSNSLTETYKKLSAILTKDEIDFFRSFYHHFESRYKIYLNESEVFRDTARRLNSALQKPEYAAFFDQLRSFYIVSDNIEVHVLYVWWPLIQRTLTPNYGGFYIMERNPSSSDIKAIEDGIVFHELVHTLSSKQGLKQKQMLTKQFLQNCNPIKKVKNLRILEEPLAVSFGQMLFLNRFKPEEFKATKKWYRNPWVNEFAIKIYPIVKASFEKNKNIKDSFINQLTPLCMELLSSRSEFK